MTTTVSGQQGQSADQGRDDPKSAPIGSAADDRQRSKYSKQQPEQGVRFDPMDHWGKEYSWPENRGAMLDEDLAQAEAQVALGAKHIAEQWRLISELQSNGQDTTVARAVLTDLERARALHVADRDHLRIIQMEREFPPAQ